MPISSCLYHTITPNEAVPYEELLWQFLVKLKQKKAPPSAIVLIRHGPQCKHNKATHSNVIKMRYPEQAIQKEKLNIISNVSKPNHILQVENGFRKADTSILNLDNNAHICWRNRGTKSLPHPRSCFLKYARWMSWSRHDMETLSALPSVCEGNPPLTCGSPNTGAVIQISMLSFG